MSLTSLALARALHSSKTEEPCGPKAHPERNQTFAGQPPRIRKNDNRPQPCAIDAGDGPSKITRPLRDAVCKVVLANRV